MLAGILLGPSAFGWIAPGIAASVYPPGGLTYLNALGQLGLVLFMFIVGAAIDVGELRHRGHSAVLISHVSIAIPVCLGVLLATQLYGTLSSPSVPFCVFALFLGAGMSITAFPVLAKILAERGMLRSPIGVLVTACAAVDDVSGWSLLAVVVLIGRGTASGLPPWVSLPGALMFVIVMVYGVRPIAAKFFPIGAENPSGAVASCLLLALSSALVTEFAGLHPAFGAFLAGAIIPRRPELIDHVVQKLEAVTNFLLLPMFFVYTGLRTQMGLVHGTEMWKWTGLIVLTAVVGKLGGCMAGALACGNSWRDALVIGTLMNTRGLMELVALNIGLDAGLISPQLFSMMVLMALVTTIMAGPVLAAVSNQHSVRKVSETVPVSGT
jgi:Kef-type K+ transport system membrane component KefB